ncbi:MAG: hypothetical protein IH948_07370 [Bacteroidetes bacterium]|nr:hypothetical protein [Bacteroidota bacterium]
MSAEKSDGLGLKLGFLDLSLVNNSYVILVNMSCEVLVRYNKYAEILSFLVGEISSIESLEANAKCDRGQVLFELFRELISYNHLFTILEWSEIEAMLTSLDAVVSGDNLKTLSAYLSIDVKKIEVRDLSISLTEPRFVGNLDEYSTGIFLVLPYAIRAEADIGIPHTISMEDGVTVSFTPITNLFNDPIYSFLSDPHIPWEIRHIHGIPWSILTDSLGTRGESTLVTITMAGVYSPDFSIEDEAIQYYDLDLENRKRGSRYYPHKDRIVELLYTLGTQNAIPLGIDLDNINANMISNYYVQYLNGEGIRIHQELFTVTNLDSYLRIRNRYQDALNLLRQSTGDETIKEFILNTKIESRESFHRFCISLIQKTCQRSIEYGSLWKALWHGYGADRAPVKETIAQPIIDNMLVYLCEMKGIILLREPASSDGHVDFYMAYTYVETIFSVGIELKNAHSRHLHHGIQTQLPRYMEGLRTKRGIYLVLWYKGKNFPEPSKFESIDIMIPYLEGVRPRSKNIQIIAIDSSVKTPPSKLPSGASI